MAENILVIVEQQQGKLNRVSLETLTGAQSIAAATGWAVEAAVVGGSNIDSAANEVAGKKVAKVYAVQSAKLDRYTPDAFSAALKQFLGDKNPKLVLMPHTYQVRDFAHLIGVRHQDQLRVFVAEELLQRSRKCVGSITVELRGLDCVYLRNLLARDFVRCGVNVASAHNSSFDRPSRGGGDRLRAGERLERDAVQLSLLLLDDHQNVFSHASVLSLPLSA